MEGSIDEGSDQQRRELILAHRHRVRINAIQILRQYGLPLSMRADVEGYGNEGLCDAAKKFNFSRGVQFGTYAEYRIRGAIKNGLETWRKGRELLALLRHPGGPEAEASASGGGPAPVDSYIERMSLFVLATAHDRLAADASLHGSDEPSPEEHLMQQEQRDKLTELLQELSPRQREVLQLSYVQGLKSVDIARKLGMDDTSVSRMRKRALAALRTQLEADAEDEPE
jgi:RNA polymerase sigma factor for flagellar operon FliA